MVLLVYLYCRVFCSFSVLNGLLVKFIGSCEELV